MKYTITDYFGDRVELEPCLELYTVHDFMGKEMPGLALLMTDLANGQPEDEDDYDCTLSVSILPMARARG